MGTQQSGDQGEGPDWMIASVPVVEFFIRPMCDIQGS